MIDRSRMMNGVTGLVALSGIAAAAMLVSKAGEAHPIAPVAAMPSVAVTGCRGVAMAAEPVPVGAQARLGKPAVEGGD